MEGKTDQDPIKNAEIPTDILRAVKNIEFFNSPSLKGEVSVPMPFRLGCHARQSLWLCRYKVTPEAFPKAPEQPGRPEEAFQGIFLPP